MKRVVKLDLNQYLQNKLCHVLNIEINKERIWEYLNLILIR